MRQGLSLCSPGDPFFVEEEEGTSMRHIPSILFIMTYSTANRDSYCDDCCCLPILYHLLCCLSAVHELLDWEISRHHLLAPLIMTCEKVWWEEKISIVGKCGTCFHPFLTLPFLLFSLLLCLLCSLHYILWNIFRPLIPFNESCGMSQRKWFHTKVLVKVFTEKQKKKKSTNIFNLFCSTP